MNHICVINYDRIGKRQKKKSHFGSGLVSHVFDCLQIKNQKKKFECLKKCLINSIKYIPFT